MKESKELKQTPTPDLTPEQLAVIKLSRKIGSQIATYYPEIAEDYRAGLTHKKITEKYGFMSEYSPLTFRTAVRAVGCALHDLIPEEELAELEKTHQSDSGKTATSRRGQAPWSDEEKACMRRLFQNAEYRISEGFVDYDKISQELEQKFGRKRNRSAILHTIYRGAHPLTKDERKEFRKKSGRKSGRAAALNRGQIPWSDEENAYFCELYQDLEHRTREGTIDHDKISQELEQKFGTKRTKKALQVQAHELGIFAFTPEERAKFYKNHVRVCASARGQSPWRDEEQAHFAELCQIPEYRTPEGFIDYNKISQELRQRFGTERSKKALQAQAHCIDVYAFSPEEREESYKNRGQASASARGLTPWPDEEKAYLLELSQNLEYCTPKGGVDYDKISQELKCRFGIARTRNALRVCLQRMQKAIDV